MEPRPTFIKEDQNFNWFEGFEKNMICLPLEETLDEAASLMRENYVGDVIIVDEREGKIIPVGIVTARRLLKILVEGLSDLTQISERQLKNEITGHH